MPGAECGDRRLLVVRVQLDLVHGGHGVGLGEDALEVRNQEVRDADARRLAAVADLLERLPRLNIQIARRCRPMDQVQVDGVEAELRQARLDRGMHGNRALVVVVQLRRDEQLVTRDPGCRDRAPDTFLIPIDGGCVDVTVADFQRVGHDSFGLGRVDLEDAKPELRDRAAVIEGQLWDGQEICLSSGPLYRLRGRMSAFDASCSMMCAVQPVIRLATNNGVNISVSNPMSRYAGPDG